MNTWLLAATFLRRGGGSRALIVGGCTAVVSGLLLVVVSVAQVETGDGYYSGPEVLGNLIVDTGVRGGYMFALVLLCLAPLTLLRQALRLGTATREKRFAALRIAGATPADLRRLGAVEVGIPALAGGLLGFLVFLGLRAVLGGIPVDEYRGLPIDAVSGMRQELALVPTTVTPSWWQLLLVAVAVGLLGAWAGARASSNVLVYPQGVSRQANPSPPRPWGVVLLGVSLVLLILTVRGNGGDDVLAMVMVLSLVLGVLTLAPWIAYRIGRLVESRASSPATLLAASRLVQDPRPAGRAAAAVGAIALVAGGIGPFLNDLPNTNGGNRNLAEIEATYTAPLLLLVPVLLVCLMLVIFSLTVHGVESLTDRRRSTASLGALGTPVSVLEKAQRWEAALVAVPVAVLGLLLTSVSLAFAIGGEGYGAWVIVAIDLGTLALVVLAVLASARITRPWLRRALAPENLRTA